MSFADHFSGHAADYARYRPDYPAALYVHLTGLCARRVRVWDCGTGNGQAALGLAAHFHDVIATDPAFNQVRNAEAAANVHYAVARAEAAPLADASVDLITVAQALHWFEFDRFYTQARRVLTRGGVLAVWGYGLNEISTEVDDVIHHYYTDIVGPYWPRERRYLDERYTTIPFPLAEEAAPSFYMEATWSLAEFRGYLATWSAAQRYARERGHDPLGLIDAPLAAVWGPAPRRVAWPMYLRVGRA